MPRSSRANSEEGQEYHDAERQACTDTMIQRKSSKKRRRTWFEWKCAQSALTMQTNTLMHHFWHLGLGWLPCRVALRRGIAELSSLFVGPDGSSATAVRTLTTHLTPTTQSTVFPRLHNLRSCQSPTISLRRRKHHILEQALETSTSKSRVQRDHYYFVSLDRVHAPSP